MTVPFAEEAIDILCCPEDHHCEEGCEKHRRCCPKCELPVCRECERAMRQRGTAAMPPAALVNDLMIFYAPQELYTKRATVMEVICASTCLTSMIRFSFEAKHRRERALDSEIHMARQCVGDTCTISQ